MKWYSVNRTFNGVMTIAFVRISNDRSCISRTRSLLLVSASGVLLEC